MYPYMDYMPNASMAFSHGVYNSQDVSSPSRPGTTWLKSEALHCMRVCMDLKSNENNRQFPLKKKTGLKIQLFQSCLAIVSNVFPTSSESVTPVVFLGAAQDFTREFSLVFQRKSNY